MTRYEVRDDELVGVFPSLDEAIQWGKKNCLAEFCVDRVERSLVYISEEDDDDPR